MTDADLQERTINGTDLGIQAWVSRHDNEAPAPDRIAPVTNREHPSAKPDRPGGFWTSTWHPEHGSGWVQWCLGEEFECDRHEPTFHIWTLKPNATARIYRIASYADLQALVDAFPHRRSYPDRGYGRWTDLKPDWQRIAEHFDGVNLTDEGQWATRLTHPLDLYGWDCESTLWFRWVFADVADQGRVKCRAIDPWWEEEAVA